MVARKPEKNTPETNPYMKKFLKISNWKPNKLGVFAGKVGLVTTNPGGVGNGTGVVKNIPSQHGVLLTMTMTA